MPLSAAECRRVPLNPTESRESPLSAAHRRCSPLLAASRRCSYLTPPTPSTFGHRRCCASKAWGTSPRGRRVLPPPTAPSPSTSSSYLASSSRSAGAWWAACALARPFHSPLPPAPFPTAPSTAFQSPSAVPSPCVQVGGTVRLYSVEMPQLYIYSPPAGVWPDGILPLIEDIPHGLVMLSETQARAISPELRRSPPISPDGLMILSKTQARDLRRSPSISPDGLVMLLETPARDLRRAPTSSHDLPRSPIVLSRDLL